MSVYHPIISYKGKTNYDFQLMVSHFSDNADSGENPTYQSMEPIYTENYDGTLRHDFGAKRTEVAMPTMTFVESDGSDISPYKIRNVLKWLTGARDVSFMDIMDDTAIPICSYVGRFTDVKLYKIDARVVGVVATFTSTSPFAYSPIKEARFTVTQDGTDFAIDNETDDIYSMLNPTVEFKNTQAKDPTNPNKEMLSLYNKTVGNTTIFKNLSTNETVTIDSGLVVYSDNTARIFNDDFNFDFPVLQPLENNFKAVGEGELVIRFRYPMKLADGLLNAYDVSGGLIVYVEETAVVLKGDLTRNPPAGTSVKVNGSTLVVRGNMKAVKLPGFSEVENGNLIVDYGNYDCPFDEMLAQVINGELFIGKDLDKVEPHYNYAGRN